MPNWSTPRNGEPGTLAGTMSEAIRQRESAVGDLLPNLGDDSELVLVSDYAGEHKAAQYQVLSFLLADRPGVLGSWEADRLAIRQRFFRDGRRFTFKGLSDQSKQR